MGTYNTYILSAAQNTRDIRNRFLKKKWQPTVRFEPNQKKCIFTMFAWTKFSENFFRNITYSNKHLVEFSIAGRQHPLTHRKVFLPFGVFVCTPWRKRVSGGTVLKKCHQLLFSMRLLHFHAQNRANFFKNPHQKGSNDQTAQHGVLLFSVFERQTLKDEFSDVKPYSRHRFLWRSASSLDLGSICRVLFCSFFFKFLVQ